MTGFNQIVRRLQQLEKLMGLDDDVETFTIKIIAVSPDGTIRDSGKVIEVPLGRKTGGKP
jgi:hypothetical protein